MPPHARDYSTLTIYATTHSFSPFYLARKGPHIKSLFDQTKAYKSGSTIPIKLQVLNASNINVSSSGTSLVTRDLRLISGNTLAPIEDSGNANPDYTFRYDPTLGGTVGGYIFNLSTKGLGPGQYVLSFYVGSDRSFFFLSCPIGIPSSVRAGMRCGDGKWRGRCHWHLSSVMWPY
jgi:hypothetical protein